MEKVLPEVVSKPTSENDHYGMKIYRITTSTDQSYSRTTKHDRKSK
jgi:hypothetical protein